MTIIIIIHVETGITEILYLFYHVIVNIYLFFYGVYSFKGTFTHSLDKCSLEAIFVSIDKENNKVLIHSC